ncbi:MAG TPA: M20/M25/M40 family metallo-hydrolase [Chitinophagaceae bacterium]|nr:M20/M25/M40 family metallo-hydrolase [Chitinophagaceae bacterium]
MRKLVLALLFISVYTFSFAQDEKLDAAMVEKIRNEGLKNSKVMEIAFYLTEVSGPRLQGSPGYTRASNWAKNKLAEWGLQNAKLEPWGDWGKGWELQRSYLAMTQPYYRPFIAFPKAWTSGSNGLKSTDVILINAKDSIELLAYKGKLKGKIVLLQRTDTLKPSFTSDALRFTDEELGRMAAWEPTAPANRPRDITGRRQVPMTTRVRDLAMQEGALALLSASTRGRDGTLFVSGGGSYAPNAPENILDIMIAYEDYMSMQRLLMNNVPVKLEVDVKTKFFKDDVKGYNVIAEIKGTDPNLKEELVMLGGHLDSWHGSVGATDNAAGCAVMMEAMRILKTLGVQPRRTIRIALWGGEEQGLHGSRNYVRNHFTDTATRRSNAAGEKVSVYFNLDNGTGKIRGIYLQGNAGAKPIFAKWLEPFNDLGASTITLRNTGGTDHQAFDAVGIPGFQFIQDEIEYDSRTHHTNMDSYDHLMEDDLKQAATIIASFVYHAAMRDEKIPRKPATTTTARN